MNPILPDKNLKSNVLHSWLSLHLIDGTMEVTFHLSEWFVCLVVFNATINNNRGGQFDWWRKPEYPEKTTDLSHVIDKLYHIMLYTSPWSRFELTASVVIGTGCIGSCKSNFYTITATMVPLPCKWISTDCDVCIK
jgi:hypothetical protein